MHLSRVLLQSFGVKVSNTVPLSFQMGGFTRRIEVFDNISDVLIYTVEL